MIYSSTSLSPCSTFSASSSAHSRGTVSRWRMASTGSMSMLTGSSMSGTNLSLPRSRLVGQPAAVLTPAPGALTRRESVESIEDSPLCDYNGARVGTCLIQAVRGSTLSLGNPGHGPNRRNGGPQGSPFLCLRSRKVGAPGGTRTPNCVGTLPISGRVPYPFGHRGHHQLTLSAIGAFVGRPSVLGGPWIELPECNSCRLGTSRGPLLSTDCGGR